MRLRSLWVAVLALPVLVATPVHGRTFIRCDGTDVPALTAGNCEESECYPQQENAAASKQKGKTAALLIDADRQIVFQVEGLICPAVKGIGCGHMLQGVLASLDKIDGVQASSANYTGTMIRVSMTPATNRDKVIEAVRKVPIARPISAHAVDRRKSSCPRSPVRGL